MMIQCQCRDCQRATGTGHADVLGFPGPAVKMTGKLKYHDVRSESGNTVGRGFCPECGSPVTSRSTGFKDMTLVAAGSLDDPAAFKPSIVVYNSHGHAWDKLDASLPKFPAMPPPR
jgi:hypothetical protein